MPVARRRLTASFNFDIVPRHQPTSLILHDTQKHTTPSIRIPHPEHTLSHISNASERLTHHAQEQRRGRRPRGAALIAPQSYLVGRSLPSPAIDLAAKDGSRRMHRTIGDCLTHRRPLHACRRRVWTHLVVARVAAPAQLIISVSAYLVGFPATRVRYWAELDLKWLSHIPMHMAAETDHGQLLSLLDLASHS